MKVGTESTNEHKPGKQSSKCSVGNCTKFDFKGLHSRELTFPIHKKGKAVLLEAWSGPEGTRKLRFPDFMTMAQDGGKVVSLTHRPPLPPGNTPGTHFC